MPVTRVYIPMILFGEGSFFGKSKARRKEWTHQSTTEVRVLDRTGKELFLEHFNMRKSMELDLLIGF